MTHVPWHPADVEAGEEILGIDSVEFVTVGIDIGTTTTHLMISRLLARRQGGEYSNKFQVVERAVQYESPILLTPYEDETTIDVDEIDEFIRSAYRDAGYTPDDVDTGAVIITGEACRKKNAEAITERFSDEAGKFVCATAGANLEALMAAHGSGAIDFSLDTDQDVLHVDIGGGTTKLAYVVDGFVEETASINVGARLVAFDEDDRIDRIEEAARAVAAEEGIDLEMGGQLSESERKRLAGALSGHLFELVADDLGELSEELMVTDVPEPRPFDVITFSGGCAEYVYGTDPGYYGDLGPQLGDAIRADSESLGVPVERLDAGIRATAIGSTNHSVQVSGSTITISDDGLLPLKNVPLLPISVHGRDREALEAHIRERLELYDLDSLDTGFAFGFHVHGLPGLDTLTAIVDSAVAAWRSTAPGHPLILAFDSDVGLNAGELAGDRVDAPVIAVDGVALDQFGYIDIGTYLEDTNAVPLTVKSLVFEG